MSNIGWKSQTEIDDEAAQAAHDAKTAITVSRAQGKIALMQSGLWDDALAAVDAIEDPTQKMVAQVALNEATEWKRGSPTMQMLSGKLGLTETQMDDLYSAAQAIEL